MKLKKTLILVTLAGSLTALGLSSCNSTSSVGLSSSSQGVIEGLAKGPDLNGEKGVAIRYTRTDNNYEDRGLWVWEMGGDGSEYEFTAVDSFGAVCFIPFSTWSPDVEQNGIGIITKKLGTWSGQSGDMIAEFANFKVDDQGYYNIFIKDGTEVLYDNQDLREADNVKYAKFITENKVAVSTSNKINSMKVFRDGELIASDDGFSSNYRAIDLNKEQVLLGSKFEIEVTFEASQKTLKSVVSKSGLFNTESFNNQFYYDGELGAIYSKEKTTFRVWSPLSTEITLRLYDSGTPKSVDSKNGSDQYQSYTMAKSANGVFEYEVSGDLDGKYYTYVVTNDTYTQKEVVDPYAKSTGVNGLRGMIIDFSKTNPQGWDNISVNSYKRTELAIYETHIADVTSSETWGGTASNAKKYSGMYETGTTYSKNNITVKTGFDHIKELGVNAVQLLPIFDQANDEVHATFNWGYNPLNYNALDGIYSSNPYDGSVKVKEFKELVKAYNEAGIDVIMDVVYNHVAGASRSNFDVLMPEYYFRYTSDGKLSNGSGCGNETRSELSMMRKFIKDSTEFWAKEYKLGGFRFDLMGLHDIQTMNEVTRNLKDKFGENFFVHGEPWTGGTSTLANNLQAKQDNIDKFEGYGAFNDKFRDSLIKGGLSSASEKGWATNTTSISETDYTNLVNGILGKTGSINADPLKSTVYVTCHDNYTLYDRIKATGFNGTDEEIAKMATLANFITFTSQGTSFMLAGEEMLRTKGGNSNSYNASYKVNELDYSRLITFSNVYNNYKKMIDIKTNFSGLHLESAGDISQKVRMNSDNTNKGIIDFEIKGEMSSLGSGEKTIRFVHAAAGLTPTNIDLSNYTMIWNSNGSVSTNSSFELTPCTSLVLVKNA